MATTLTQQARRRFAVVAMCGAGALAGGCAPAITTQQEVQAGAEYAAEINRQLPLVRDQQANDYINRLGRQIARTADSRGIPYTFYIVNSDVVNAFAIPGGYVYVNRGLIERSDNMSELAGVLGHEIGHVVERHAVERLQRAQNANTMLGVLYGVLLRRNPGTLEQAGIQIGGNAVFAGYSRDAEREADRVAVTYLTRTGISPQGMVTMFQQLMEQQRTTPSKVEGWFATHPLSQERITNTQATINATAGATSAQLSRDTQEFQRFRARLRSLQPQPTDRNQ